MQNITYVRDHLPEELTPPRSQRVLRQPQHRLDLIATDFFLINFGFFVSSLLAYGISPYAALPWQNIGLILFVNVTWALITVFNEAYVWNQRVRIENQIFQVIKLVVYLLAANAVFYMTVLNDVPHYPFFLPAHFLALIFVIGSRVLHRKREVSPFQEFSYVIVGGKQNNLRSLLDNYAYCFPGSATLVGRFGNTDYDGIRNIGSYADIKAYLATDPPIDKLVFFYSSHLSKEEEDKIVQMCYCRMIEVVVAPRESSLFRRGYKAHQLGDMTVLRSREVPLNHLRNRITKRIFDIFFSLFVLIGVYPFLYLIVAPLVYLADPGPIYFKQLRSGYRNKPFWMWKFRSMTINEQCDEDQAVKDDPRVTRIGGILRKTSLDEFPQFINVLRGEMSVVGPRPHMIKHTEKYAELIDEYMIRHQVKPGVTGLAQVNGYRGPTPEVEKMEKRVEYDVHYLENWSVIMDIKIIIKTVTDGFKKDPNRL